MTDCGTYADGIIAVAYLLVGVALLYIRLKRPDLVKSWILWFFAPVFVLCGAGHLAHFLHMLGYLHPAAVVTTMYVQAVVAIPALVALIPVVRYITGGVSQEQYDAKAREAERRAKESERLALKIQELQQRISG